jgi:hypothetical protein
MKRLSLVAKPALRPHVVSFDAMELTADKTQAARQRLATARIVDPGPASLPLRSRHGPTMNAAKNPGGVDARTDLPIWKKPF